MWVMKWMWVHQKYGTSQIINKLFSVKTTTSLTLLLQRWSDESTKQWMWVMKYECECNKNMEWVKLCKNCIHPKQTNSLTLLFLPMVSWIDKTMKLTNWNSQTVAIIINHMNMHCSRLVPTQHVHFFNMRSHLCEPWGFKSNIST